jgi:hypothetical protein
VEKGKSNLKKRTRISNTGEGEEDQTADKANTSTDEEEQNDYTIKKTTKGSEFYDDFMNQVIYFS